MKTVVTFLVALALLGGGLVGILVLRRQNAALRNAIGSADRAHRAPLASARRAATPTTTAPIPPSRPSAAAQKLAEVRAEVATLEARATAEYTRRLTMVPGTNPEEAMTPLENLRNVGQATPARAFQTLAWAGLHGDAAAMTSAIGISPDALPEAQALWEGLPPAEREKYSTPQALFALYLARGFVNVSGIQIAKTTFTDGQNAEITVRGLVLPDQQLPMRLGPTGWQLWEGKSQIAWLRRELGKSP